LNVAAYLANSTPVTVGTGVYSGANAVNGASYDGNTGGFYSVGAGAVGTTNRGDVQQYNSLATFLAGVPDTVSVTNYNGNVVNFFDTETTPGTTVPAGGSVMINAQYYQVSGGGGLEGFASLASYIAGASNRVNFSVANAFGGTNPPYQARTAFAVPVPEPTSLLLCFGAVCGMFAARRG
jgi:hypothetical protein